LVDDVIFVIFGMKKIYYLDSIAHGIGIFLILHGDSFRHHLMEKFVALTQVAGIQTDEVFVSVLSGVLRNRRIEAVDSFLKFRQKERLSVILSSEFFSLLYFQEGSALRLEEFNHELLDIGFVDGGHGLFEIMNKVCSDIFRQYIFLILKQWFKKSF